VHCGEACEEVPKSLTTFEVIQKRLDRNPNARKDRAPAQDFWIGVIDFRVDPCSRRSSSWVSTPVTHSRFGTLRFRHNVQDNRAAIVARSGSNVNRIIADVDGFGSSVCYVTM